MRIFLLFIVSLLFSTALFSKNLYFKHQNLKLKLPSSFVVVSKDLTSLNAHTKDKKAKITLTFLPKKLKTKTLQNISRILNYTIKNFKPTSPPKARIINKLSMMLFTGKGSYNNKTVNVKGALIQTKSKMIAMFLTMVNPQYKKRYDGKLIKILNSIQSIRYR